MPTASAAPKTIVSRVAVRHVCMSSIPKCWTWKVAAYERPAHSGYPDYPNCHEPRFGGNSGNRGNGLAARGFQPFHPIKKVATSGNTHLSFNIRGGYNSAVWLSPLPQKNGWQQNGNEKDGWMPWITRVLPPLPRLPHFLKPQQHVYVCEASCPGNPEHAAQVPRTSLKMALSFFGGNKGNGGTPSKTVACGCSPLLSVWGTGGTQTCFSIGTAFASPAFERFLSPIKKHGVQSPPLEASKTVGVPTVH